MTDLLDPQLEAPEISFLDFARWVVDANPDVHDIQELAMKMYKATPEGMISTYYLAALPRTMSVVIAGMRNVPPPALHFETPSKRSGKLNRSHRREATAEDWLQQKLNARLGIPGAGLVPLRQCTITQVESYADYVIGTGHAQVASGMRWKRLAEIGLERGYATGEDFPEDVLKEVFG